MRESFDIRLENLSKVFAGRGAQGETAAVRDVSFTVRGGELVTLLGPSGCGKTTTLRMVAGFETPTSGQIYLGGEAVTAIPPNRRDVTMVFQSYGLFPHLSVEENVAYGLRVRKVERKEIARRVNAVLDLVGLAGYGSRMPNQLSGGQQQRVALARAIVCEPKALLFDEPLSNLDALLRETMREEIRKLQQRLGITALYVTHDQAEAMVLSDRIVVMNAGRVEQIATPQELYHRPANRFVASFIGRANFLEGRVVDTDEGAPVVELLGARMRWAGTGEAQGSFSVMVRPECVLLSDQEGFPGRLTAVTYYGSAVHYTVELEGGASLVAVDGNPGLGRAWRSGDRVGVVLPPQALHALAG
ncbi:MAG: ABC transporter ATP-binding protein [Chitinophagales bacterium]